MPDPQQVLRDTFGLADFRPGQKEVVDHLLAGRSAAACFPTGGGKSLCYQLPALMLPGLTVVVSPLIALMKEQVDRLQAKGVAAERLDSTRDSAGVASVGDRVRQGQLRLLYVAPERFNNERFRQLLLSARVSLFAVDEAHCISEWGHNFRPDYLKLAHFARACGAERVLALTATATPTVLADICKGFAIDPGCAVRTGFHRPNLTLRTTPIDAARRDALLLERLRANPGPRIVYVTLQRTAEAVAQTVAGAGLPARAYHAGMQDEERAAVQEWFAAGSDAIVVATIAFGMGIDKADIRGVYHYNLPKSLENWSQEIGRAGRDGKPSQCELFACPGDLNALENFVYGDTPSRESIAGLVVDLFCGADELELTLYDLSAEHDLRPLVLNTLLTYLELDGWLEAGTPFYAGYQFKPLTTSKEILARFQGERRQFLAGVFRHAVKARLWFSLDLEAAARATSSTRDRIVRALDWLAEQNLLEVQASQVRHRYRVLRRPEDAEAVAEDLHQRTLQREQREIGRLRQVLELIEHDGCQVSRLGEHFGEALASPCGHCSWCLSGGKGVRLPARVAPPPDARALRQAKALRDQHPEVLGDPRALTRFLCGLTSPRLNKAKLSREALFGALAEVPFPEVLAWARQG
jgi:ATP-dependent DNA helicase RecQ